MSGFLDKDAKQNKQIAYFSQNLQEKSITESDPYV